MNQIDLTNNSITGSNNRKIEAIKEILKDIWSINFHNILQELCDIELSTEDKISISKMLIIKIQEFVVHGQWWQLDWAKELIDFLWIEVIEYSNEWIENINKLYNRYNYWFLISLSPSLYNGKLVNWKVYDNIKFTREKLIEIGSTEEELTDEYINSLWMLRELLLKMYYYNLKIDTKLSINDILALK